MEMVIFLKVGVHLGNREGGGIPYGFYARGGLGP
jgi:hypothetical protein